MSERLKDENQGEQSQEWFDKIEQQDQEQINIASGAGVVRENTSKVSLIF
jgi:hypothetical protein